MILLKKITELKQNKLYTNEHLNGNNVSYQKFILLSYRRCGSNYFLDLLRSHPEIISYAGLFEENKIGFIYPGYPKFTCKKTLTYRDKYPISFLKKRIFRNFNSNIKAVGFKMVYESNHPIVFEYLKHLPDLKIIHIQRKNLLKVHLSDMIAEKTQKWHVLSKKNEQEVKNNMAESFIKIIENSNEDTLPANFKIELNYENCLKEFNKITKLTEEFKLFFSNSNVHIVYYENLIIDSQNEIFNILDFLDIKQYALTSRFIKINNRNLSDVISNYSELKEKFKGSKWEVFFED